MRILRFVAFGLVFGFALRVNAADSPTPDKVFISRAAAKALLDADKAMDPKTGDKFRRLDRAFPGRQQFSVAEVLAIRVGKPKDLPGPPPVWGDQTGERPRDAWTPEQVRLRFEALEEINPEAKGLMERLEKRVPNAKWYTTEQVLNAENFAKIERTPEQWARYEVLADAYQEARKGEARSHQGVGWPRLRRDWRDVIYDEDQSQGSNRKAYSDLEGALFSYAHNGRGNIDTWNTHAALILPIIYQPLEDREGLEGKDAPLWRFAAAPSVTYDRVSTSGDPEDEVDSLFYRLGLFLDVYDQTGTDQIVGYGLQLRAAGVHVTDQDHQAGLTGFELDLEPRLWVGDTGPNVGYVSILSRKHAPVRSDGTDISLLEAQFRTWLHVEAGDIQSNNAAWSPVTESFFRLGPTVLLQLSMPSLPGDRALSLTALYSHLFSVSGSDDRSNYFRASLSYDLFRDVEFNHKVSLTASFEKGGLNFTKQKVDTFTLGLGVLF